jgi:HPt (histidine-containing phosphotransfer) domain-containing protein
MASGDLAARVKITSSDEIGTVGKQFNLMVESLAQRTEQLYEKTNDIHAMLQNMPQGILTIVGEGKVHPEYSAYLEKILESSDLAGKSAMALIFDNASVGSDECSQIEAAIDACIGEDLMNFDFNSHLLVSEINKTMPDGRIKCLDLSWSPICDIHGVVEKIMLCVRDVTELRQLEAEAEHQKRELEMIGQILKVNQEKFGEFVTSARKFVADNKALLSAASNKDEDLINRLFRNMHTIKGNARTYGLLHLTNIVHEAEQAYDELRKNGEARFDKVALLSQLEDVQQGIEEYAVLNEVKLGRKGPGRRGSAEKYVMLEREQVERMVLNLEQINLREAHTSTLVSALQQVKLDLRLIGTERIQTVLDGVFESLPSLARELGKEPPKLLVNDNGIQIRNQVSDLLRNVFMHLYRNSMDHGIEAAADRLVKGKPASGTIQLDLALHEDQLMMRLKDDGKGLALAYIRSKAIERGLIAEAADVPDSEVAKLIFAAGFSTAKAVTEVSGRGVGMDAVQDFIKREGGEIRLALTDNQTGAAFREFEMLISLPAKFAVDALLHTEINRTAERAKDKPSEHGSASDLLSIARDFLMPGKFANI